MSTNAQELLSEDAYSHTTFESLGLSPQLLKALDEVGYETPSAIQLQTIPQLLTGRDLLGQAQTGTGKTAAFALPLLMRLDLSKQRPQALVLTPTRELAIQVAAAFEKYAAHLPRFHVLPIYGGQGYDTQLRQLKRGPMVVVGTPGRVMDHIRRKTLQLSDLTQIVLDEADEMLRMGFLEDVEWILEQCPQSRQTALFSATMPEAVRRIARTHMQKPAEVTVKASTTTVEAINQRYCLLNNPQKIDALTRILEAEEFDGVLVFVRTKTATLELDEKLRARGFACAPLNGDIAQNQRERTVEQIKKGKLDILIATDVAARGLDIDRISHVINFDIPYDTEAYVHRIGRTGRAGRSGQAILFVAPRERRMLQLIERSTKQQIALMQLPTNEEINKKRVAQFKQRISDTLSSDRWKQFSQLVEEYRAEHDMPELQIAAALASMAHGGKPLTMSSPAPKKTFEQSRDAGAQKAPRERSRFVTDASSASYRIAVGRTHGVRPANIVGAIANEGGITSAEIGNINIQDSYSTVDLPANLSEEVLDVLAKTWVSGQQLAITRSSGASRAGTEHRGRLSQNREGRDSYSREAKVRDSRAEKRGGDKYAGGKFGSEKAGNKKPYAKKSGGSYRTEAYSPETSANDAKRAATTSRRITHDDASPARKEHRSAGGKSTAAGNTGALDKTGPKTATKKFGGSKLKRTEAGPRRTPKGKAGGKSAAKRSGSASKPKSRKP